MSVVEVSSARRRRRQPEPPAALGSLTQVRDEPACVSCGFARVTRLELRLTDGTDVVFTNCPRCEARQWHSAGTLLEREDVLRRATKTA